MSFEQQVPALRQRVEQVLQAALPAESYGEVSSAMRYAVLGGGKRIRPLFTYAAGELLGVAAEQLDPAAAAVELIHAYSLIHDDLPAMDDDELRRGQPTVHIRFDEATAILAGDALQSLAFELLAGNPAPAAGVVDSITVLSRAAGARGMVGGQALDMAYEGQAAVSAEQVERMFALKTGALIAAAIDLAACFADAIDADSRERLHRFGRLVGLAFQVHDDVLDVTADTQTLGKPQGSDEARDKASYPARFGLETAQARAEALFDEALSELAPFGDKAEGLAWLARLVVKRDY